MQILLERGVKSVTGVDVGTDQLDTSLRSDERVKIYEKTDVREFAKTHQNKVRIRLSSCFLNRSLKWALA